MSQMTADLNQVTKQQPSSSGPKPFWINLTSHWSVFLLCGETTSTRGVFFFLNDQTIREVRLLQRHWSVAAPFLSPSESFRWDILSTERQSCSVWRGDLTNSSQPRIRRAEKRQGRISFTWNIDAPSKVALCWHSWWASWGDGLTWSLPNHFLFSVSYIRSPLASSPLFWLLGHLISIFKRGCTQAHGINPKSTSNKKRVESKIVAAKHLNSLLIWRASGPSSSLHKNIQSIAINQFKPTADKSLRSDSEKLLLKDKQSKWVLRANADTAATGGNNHQNWRVRLSRRRKQMRI